MTLIDRIGPHTRRRLEQAAARRFAEADGLIEGKHHLTAIYLFGYVVEMIIGAAYCKNLGYGLIDPIDDRPTGYDAQLGQATQQCQGSITPHRRAGSAPW